MKEIFFNLVKKPAAWITFGVLLLSLAMSIWTMSSPIPRNDPDGFSADNVYAMLETIAAEEHSVFDFTAIENVRQYIERKIGDFGLQPIRRNYPQIEVRDQKNDINRMIDITNIYAEIEGTSGSYILLMAHYDSCPYKVKYGVATEGSFGAADDGYGVASLLEMMRLLTSLKAAGHTFVNGVKFAFTDAEEVALGGAQALVDEAQAGSSGAFLQGVNIVINVEARGVKGPLYMFQTSSGNKNLMALYKNASRPFSFSIAADVYKILPNDSDFSPFLHAGYAGLNFAVLDSLKQYHTPDDAMKNVSKPAIQAYGNQIYPIVTEYIGDVKYSNPAFFAAGVDSVFFTLLPHIFVSYTTTASWIFIVLLLLGTGAAIFFAIKKKLLNWKKALISLGLWFAFMLSCGVVGLALAWLLGIVTGNKFSLMNMPGVPFDLGFLIIFIVGVFVAAFFMRKLFKKLSCKFFDVYAGLLFLLVLFTLATAFFLHGGTYLLLWPAVILAGLLGLQTAPEQKWMKYAKYALSSLTMFVTFLLFAYLIYSLYLALTFGILAGMLLFAGLAAGIILVAAENQFQFDKPLRVRL